MVAAKEMGGAERGAVGWEGEERADVGWQGAATEAVGWEGAARAALQWGGEERAAWGWGGAERGAVGWEDGGRATLRWGEGADCEGAGWWARGQWYKGVHAAQPFVRHWHTRTHGGWNDKRDGSASTYLAGAVKGYGLLAALFHPSMVATYA